MSFSKHSSQCATMWDLLGSLNIYLFTKKIIWRPHSAARAIESSRPDLLLLAAVQLLLLLPMVRLQTSLICDYKPDFRKKSSLLEISPTSSTAASTWQSTHPSYHLLSICHQLMCVINYVWTLSLCCWAANTLVLVIWLGGALGHTNTDTYRGTQAFVLQPIQSSNQNT